MGTLNTLLDLVVALTTGLLFGMVVIGSVVLGVCSATAGGCLWWRRRRRLRDKT